jgi:hypothetical protein
MVSTSAAAPASWQVRRRVQVVGGTGVQGCGGGNPGCANCIPNSHCANRNHSYGDTFWQAQANTAGSDAVFQIPVGAEGLWKVSLWWPNVVGANPATQVQVEAIKAGGPARANAVFDQRRGFGRWNDVGMPFTFTTTPTGAQVSVRIRRASPQAGWVLADAVRILKVR